MKVIFKLSILLLLITIANKSFSQVVVPEGILFQAVTRDLNNNAASNRNVYVQVAIKRTTPNGVIDYAENFKVFSSPEGIFSIIIGQGDRLSGVSSLKNLDWSRNIYFVNIKIAIEPTLPDPSWTAAKNYIDIGTSQFWTVPYSFTSNNAKFSDSASTITGILPSDKGGTGVNNNGKTITIANNIITKGVGDLTITTTAASDIIFPVSGTLANTQFVSDRIGADTISLSNRINALGNTLVNVASNNNPGLALELARISNILNSATSNNTPNTIVKRDGSGGFSTGTITGSLSGTASNANALTTPRTISTSGDVIYTSEGFDGTGNVTGVATLSNSGVASGTYGTSTSVPIITVDNKGRITNASSTNIPSATSTVTGLLTSTDYANFSAKQGSLTSGSGISIVSGTISASDATSNTKGIIQLTKDLGGTANAPIVNSVGGVLSSTITTLPTQIAANTLSITSNTTSIASNTLSITTLETNFNNLPPSSTIVTLAGTQSLTNKSINGVTPNVQNIGFSVSGGTLTPTTLTVLKDVVLGGVNTGDQYFELLGDVTGGGVGTFTSTVNSVGGVLSSTITAVASSVNSATSNNTPNTIVKRDGSGGFSTGTITGSLSGTASNANALTTPRTISTSGDVIYTSEGFDGTGNVTGVATLSNSGVASGTYGTSTSVPIITVDNKGRITNASSTNIPSATSTVTGLLTSTDYANFSAKQESLTAGSGISIVSGTISATGITSDNLSSTAGITNGQLANSSVTIGATSLSLGGTYTSVTGLTSVTSDLFTGTLSGTASNANALTTPRTISTTGDITSTGSFDGTSNLSLATTLANSGVVSGTYGNSGNIPKLTVDSKGRVTGIEVVAIGSSAIGSPLGTNKIIVGNASNMAAEVIMSGDVAIVSSGNTTVNSVGGVLSSTITTVASSVNSATSNNTPNTIVKRDDNGGFSAATISATSISSGTLTLTTPLSVANGGTGASTLTGILKGNGTGSISNAVSGTDYVLPNTSITGSTKTKITYDAKGLVTTGADATTADIAESTNKNYVTDAQKSGVLSNTSGVNTGDETASTIRTKLGVATLSGSNTGDQTITLTGDVTGSGTGTFTTTIASSKVTYSKIQNVAANKILGSTNSSSAAVVGEVTIGAGLSLTNGTLTASGTGGSVTSVSPITITTTSNTFTSSVANASSTPSITLNIPSLSITGTTTGLLSKTDYDIFKAKQSALTLGNGIETFLSSPTSANLAAAVTSDIGTGSLVFSKDATLTNATLSGTLTLTTPLSIANGGTGSNTKNFVDLSTNQSSIGGIKQFTSDITVNGVKIGIGSGTSPATTNTALGNSALYNNTTGSENTAIGSNALKSNTSGGQNTAIGYFSLFSNTTGVSNNAFGMSSLLLNTSGTSNNAYGESALQNNLSGINNTAMGHQALQFNTTAHSNVAIGNYSLQSNTTGNENTALGKDVLYYNSGDKNTAIGKGALIFNTSGYQNSSIGNMSGATNSSGYNNTFIGYSADASSSGLFNSTSIGNGAIVSASNSVRIGNTSITSIGGQVAWTAASDVRIKRNISNTKYGLETVMLLRPVDYNLISNDLRQVGFIAQEVQKIVPEVVTGKEGDLSKGEILGITYSNLVPVLTKAVQELNHSISKIQNDLNEKLSYTSPTQLVLGNKNVKEVITTADVTIGEVLSVKHLKGSSSVPSIETASGSGKSSSAKITGTDMSGIIEVTIGDVPTSNGVLATIQYSAKYSGAPVVIITPGNAATASLMGTSTVFVGSNTSADFTLNTNQTPLFTKTTYKWYYQVIQ